MSAISFQGVSKTYLTAKGPFTALNDVSFDIRPGEFFGLLGPNGAGKTTLISILAGLTRASAGRVPVNSFDVVTDFANARRALGVVPRSWCSTPSSVCEKRCGFKAGTSVSETMVTGLMNYWQVWACPIRHQPTCANSRWYEAPRTDGFGVGPQTPRSGIG